MSTARVRWLLVGGWAACILVGTSVPQLPDVASGSDKSLHLFAYAVLGLLVARALAGERQPRWRLWIYALVACAVFGALDEFHQRFIPGREADVRDWIADCAGALIGSAALYRRRAVATTTVVT